MYLKHPSKDLGEPKPEPGQVHFHELEKLGVGWPDPVILGLLDVLMNAKKGPLRNVRVIVE
jgi:hypothetical protein